MDQSKIEYSVVVPVYNSENTLRKLCERIDKVFKDITSHYEIIMVDDGSKDNSWAVMQELHNRDKRIKIIQLIKNFGQHNAIMCGFHFVQGDYAITLDDDLQNPPEEIPKLIKEIKSGNFDVVYGEFIRKKHNLFRNMGSNFIQFIYRKIFRLKRKFTTFRIIKNEIIQNAIKYDKNYVFIDGLVALNTQNIGYVNVAHLFRKQGKSGYSLGKLLKLSFNIITNFSLFPLQIASLLGFIFALFGFILGIYYLIRRLFFNVPVQGYTSLILAVVIFSGVQLITLGIIGEYIGRMHLNINKIPQFIIKDKDI